MPLVAMPLAGCVEDLGDPVIRYAEWDASAPTGDGGAANTNSNNQLADYVPDCGPDYYPCPPYATKRGGIVENFQMTAVNDAARDYTADGAVLSMADLRGSGAKLLFVFLTAGW